MKQGFKMIAAVAVIGAAAAMTLPASWMDVSAGAQAEPTTAVALRTRVAIKGNDDIVAPVVAVRRPRVELPEELSLLVVGAALVGLAGVLRRETPDERARRGLHRSHITDAASSRRVPRVASARRSS